MDYLMIFLEILGTIAFSVSGAIEAMKKEMDMLGVLVLGLVTAVGGGIIRDVLIGQLPPASFRNPRNALIAISVAFIAFLIGFAVSKRKQNVQHTLWNQVLLISDAVGLGTFTVLGIRYVQEISGYDNPALLLFVGVVTGVGGGLIRDVFAGNVPYIFRKHVYATASIAGAAAYLCLQNTGYLGFAAVASVIAVLVLRLLAAHFEWNLPRVRLHD
ncbi:MAG: TRIC cation channel family protein [Lachnospira sp.]|nr:TRIC cation channel family protein [Lachnospira sp.]